MLVISLAAEKIGSIAGFPVTNSLVATWLVMEVLFIFTYFATRKLSLVPGKVQIIAEMVIGGLYDFFSQAAGHHINKFFPLIASLFLFIITANWMGLLPGFSTIGFYHTRAESHEAAVKESEPVKVTEKTEDVSAAKDTTGHEVAKESAAETEVTKPSEGAGTETKTEEKKEEVEFIPIFRAATADLNTTVALALIAVVAIQYFGFTVLGVKYGSKFLNFKDPISFFLGILESVSDISKIISFAFRLFGNIFAGEVLLAVMAFLLPFIAPLPFLTLELFVGFIQALVFSMLTAVFLNVAVSHEEH
jgi:F-type H+-transporting ATPase subunit a